MQTITGTIERTIFHKTSDFSDNGNKYLIALFTHEQDGKSKQSKIKGELNSIIYGWQYKLYGEWRKDRYGDSFVFDSFEPIIARSHEGMADFLARSVPEVGKVRARSIVDKFGDDVFTILRTDPDRISEVEGLTSRAHQAIEEYFTSDNTLTVDPAAYARLYDLLQPIRPPRRVVNQLLEGFGSNAPQYITENPYKLMDYPGMGWLRIDKFAVEVLKYQKTGIERHRRAAIEVLARNAESGHTKIEIATMHVDSSRLLGSPLSKESIETLIDDGLVLRDDQDWISSHNLYRAELSIADQIRRLRSCDDPDLGFDLDDDMLEDEQKLIPHMIRMNPVSIISGVPGSGKSTSISIIIKRLIEQGIEGILIVAPTGKAAKRNDELIHNLNLSVPIMCSTIHYALGGKLSDVADEGIPEEEARINRGRNRFTFEYGFYNKLSYQVYIIDESSMVDVSLGAMFLEAIPDGSRVILVGDHYQLPSVGPGSFLRDLMASGIPCVILDKPRRNSGSIAHACYLIKDGRMPDPDHLNRDDNSNWTHVEIKDDARILKMICDIHVNYIAKFGKDKAKSDLQVVSPQKKDILGCFNLNKVLGSIVNPSDVPPIPSKDDDEDAAICEGDKIVRTKNGFVRCIRDKYKLSEDHDEEIDFCPEDKPTTIRWKDKEYLVHECHVVNGDGGEVIGFHRNDYVVRFLNPTRICLLPKSDAKITLAYALTVHKCQGSGFPVVIMPLTNYYWNPRDNTGLFSRELIYTAFSRPQDRLITVGRLDEAYKAISRITINQRKTRLREMLKDIKIIDPRMEITR